MRLRLITILLLLVSLLAAAFFQARVADSRPPRLTPDTPADSFTASSVRAGLPSASATLALSERQDESPVFDDRTEENDFIATFVPGGVRGRVLVEGGEPVGDVFVALCTGKPDEPWNVEQVDVGRTDAAGSFEFDPRDGSAADFLMAGAEGFELAFVTLTHENENALEVLLRRPEATTVLEGLVTTSSGQPVEAFTMHVRTNEAFASSLTSIEAFADESGAFRLPLAIPNLTETSVLVRVQAQDCRTFERALVLRSGQHLTGLHWVLEPGERVSGRIVDVAGVAASGARVHPCLSGGRHLPEVFASDDSGEFATTNLELQPVVALWVEAPGCAPRWIRSDDTSGTWEDLDIVLERGALIFGSVQDARGFPRIGCRVQVWTDGPNDWRRAFRPLWSREVLTDESGLYEISNVPLGDLRIGRVGTSDDGSTTRDQVRSIRLETASATRHDIRVPAGATVRGRVQLPFSVDASWIAVELNSMALDAATPIATWSGLDSSAFVFAGIPVEDAGRTAMRLTIALSPDHFVERVVELHPGDVDLGCFEFTLESMAEFNRETRISSTALQRAAH